MSWAHRMYFVGNRDSATLIRSSALIAIEFRPHGAFPIFGVPMSETANRLWETDSVFGPWSREVQETVNNRRGMPERDLTPERVKTLAHNDLRVFQISTDTSRGLHPPIHCRLASRTREWSGSRVGQLALRPLTEREPGAPYWLNE